VDCEQPLGRGAACCRGRRRARPLLLLVLPLVLPASLPCTVHTCPLQGLSGSLAHSSSHPAPKAPPESHRQPPNAAESRLCWGVTRERQVGGPQTGPPLPCLPVACVSAATGLEPCGLAACGLNSSSSCAAASHCGSTAAAAAGSRSRTAPVQPALGAGPGSQCPIHAWQARDHAPTTAHGCSWHTDGSPEACACMQLHVEPWGSCLYNGRPWPLAGRLLLLPALSVANTASGGGEGSPRGGRGRPLFRPRGLQGGKKAACTAGMPA